MERSFFCSWSGGKDSCLAYWKAVKQGYTPRALVTMMTEDPDRSRSHGVRGEMLAKQAASIGLPLVMEPTTWADYEANFTGLLNRMKDQKIHTGVYGDIDLREHLDWIIKVSATAGIDYLEPLWQMDRLEVVRQFLGQGFKAKIIAVKAGTVPEKYLGTELSTDLIRDFQTTGIDPAGEGGEFHTFVYAGPIFRDEIIINPMDITRRDGYIFLDFI
jgi:diphthine-ammonia ligase